MFVLVAAAILGAVHDDGGDDGGDDFVAVAWAQPWNQAPWMKRTVAGGILVQILLRCCHQFWSSRYYPNRHRKRRQCGHHWCYCYHYCCFLRHCWRYCRILHPDWACQLTIRNAYHQNDVGVVADGGDDGGDGGG